MKVICDEEPRLVPNGLGGRSYVERTLLEVEAADVGTSIPDYLGHGQPARVLKAEDVGQTLCRDRDRSHPRDYHSWSFGTPPMGDPTERRQPH